MARTEDSHVAKLASQENPGESQGITDPRDSDLPEFYPVVAVRDESPALCSAHVVALSSANPVRPVLPQDPRRRRAVLLAVDNDVYLSSSREGAQAAYPGTASTTSTLAFYLPKSVPLPVTTKATMWAAVTTTASASRVSVLVESDDE